MKKIRNILAMAMVLVLFIGLIPNLFTVKAENDLKEIKKIVLETNFKDVYGAGKEIKPITVKVLEGEVSVKFLRWNKGSEKIQEPYKGKVFNAKEKYDFTIQITPIKGYTFGYYVDFIYDGIQDMTGAATDGGPINVKFSVEHYLEQLALNKPVEKPVDKQEEKTEEKPVEKVELAPLADNELRAIITIGSKAINKVSLAGENKTEMDAAAYIKNGRTMLPLRFVAEALGLSVEWVGETRTAIVQDSQYKVEIPVDTNKIIVNGIETTSDVKPEIVKGRTMLAVANIARALGLEDGKGIVWDAATKQVTLTRAINQ